MFARGKRYFARDNIVSHFGATSIRYASNLPPCSCPNCTRPHFKIAMVFNNQLEREQLHPGAPHRGDGFARAPFVRRATSQRRGTVGAAPIRNAGAGLSLVAGAAFSALSAASSARAPRAFKFLSPRPVACPALPFLLPRSSSCLFAHRTHTHTVSGSDSWRLPSPSSLPHSLSLVVARQRTTHTLCFSRSSASTDLRSSQALLSSTRRHSTQHARGRSSPLSRLESTSTNAEQVPPSTTPWPVKHCQRSPHPPTQQ